MQGKTQLQSRVAGLAGDDGHVISGVAIGNNDLTRGLEDTWKLWTPEELRAAAASLEGTPLNPLHSNAEVGEVTKAGYDPDRGVIYEAEVDDAQLAENLDRGNFEVSIEAKHADGGTVEHDGREAMLASNIRFTGMAIVQRGAAPSASAEPGEQAALSPADISAALEESPASTEGDAEDIDISDSTETALENKVEEHNDEAPESKQVTLSMLKKVYRRGAGAWFSSNAGATQQQWALARVNAYLEDLMADRQLNSGNDNDLAPDGYDAAEAALVEVNGTEVDLEAPARVKNAVEAGMEAKEEYDEIGDCGTGVGEDIGEAILNDDLTPDIILNGGDIADNGGPVTYLSSHAEDAPDSAPTEWDEETWTDGCGPVQDALWGHYLEWFEGKQEELEAAMEESDMAYHRDESAEMQNVPDEYVFDNPGEAVSKAQEMGLDGAADDIIHTHGEGEDTVFMPAPSHDELMEMLQEMGEVAEMAEMKNVGPIDFEGTTDGDFDESELPDTLEGREGHYLNPGETEDASSFPLVGPDGNLSRERLDAAWGLRGSGDLGMPRDTAERVMLNLGLVFGPPDSEANPLPQDAYADRDDLGTPYAADAADDSVSPEHGRDEGRQDSAQPHDTTTMGDDISDAQQRVNELKAELSDVREERDELAAQVEQYEQKEEAYEAAAEEFATALADSGETLLDEAELVDRFSVAELAAKVEDTEAATLAGTEPAVQSGGSESDTETASLSETEQAEVSEHREVIANLADSDSTIATKERERRADLVAEKTGEDPETILEQEA